MIRAKLILKPMVLSLLLASSVATAQSKDQDSYFLLGETAVGKAIKEATGATIFGLAQVGYSRNDVTSSSDKNKSRIISSVIFLKLSKLYFVLSSIN